ncbi:Rv2732c family membrane protein [Pseudonocardia asaccharolytica]|uniref:Uncharacterized protein n=1 Tax=Pseudonocardia asaccharolytica DSM 44247 = NBRC 16224 TaxID=1123024 RepID=A0A511D2L0_9PSEU|nr:hypothetical protein [Pseudonocardia asaccharolytica]GEL19000.1 hypothetical protein PA7_28370 [Pseudonocardia asaccharolytica DSM 44247 = NBRC 16224]
MSEPFDDLRQFDEELREVERRVEQRIDPGAAGLVTSITVLVLIGAFLLPWVGPVAGWEVLAGAPSLGVLPRLFTFTALGFGVFGSALALSTRLWALAWVCAVGCGISVVTGVWAIWSRQVTLPEGGIGPGIGLVMATLAVVVLTGAWSRIALARR